MKEYMKKGENLIFRNCGSNTKEEDSRSIVKTLGMAAVCLGQRQGAETPEKTS